MKHLLALSIGFVLAASFSACGNKGALYLPDQPNAKQSAQTASQAPQKQQIEKKQ